MEIISNNIICNIRVVTRSNRYFEEIYIVNNYLTNDNSSKKHRIDSLQAIRALAFMGILTSHSRSTHLGAWGVSVFFILSGFVMIYAYQDRELDNSFIGSIKFSLKKIKKLYPLHIIMMLSAIVFVVFELMKDFSMKALYIQIGELVLNVLLLQSWVPASDVYFSLNGVAWYLSACVFIYAMFPTLLRLIKKMNIKQLIIGVFAIYLLQIVLGFFSQYIEIPGDFFDNFPKWFTYVLPAFRLGDFLIGCFVGKLYFEKRFTINKYLATFIEAATIALIFVAQWIYVHPERFGIIGGDWFRCTMIFTPTSVLLILMFAINKGLISKVLTIKPILYIGNISAYTFLIHQMVIRYLEKVFLVMFNIKLNPWIMTIAALVVTIIVAEIYRFFEKKIKHV